MRIESLILLKTSINYEQKYIFFGNFVVLNGSDDYAKKKLLLINTVDKRAANDDFFVPTNGLPRFQPIMKTTSSADYTMVKSSTYRKIIPVPGGMFLKNTIMKLLLFSFPGDV